MGMRQILSGQSTANRSIPNYAHVISFLHYNHRNGVQVCGCRCKRLFGGSLFGGSLFGGRRLCVRPFSAFGSLWLALIVIAIVIVLDLGLLGAGRALGRGTRAGSEH